LRTTYQPPPRLPNLAQTADQQSRSLIDLIDFNNNAGRTLGRNDTHSDRIMRYYLDEGRHNVYYPPGAEIHARWENTNFYPGVSRGINLSRSSSLSTGPLGISCNDSSTIRHFLSAPVNAPPSHSISTHRNSIFNSNPHFYSSGNRFYISNGHFKSDELPQLAHPDLANINYRVSFLDGDIDDTIPPYNALSIRARATIADEITPTQRAKYDTLLQRAFSGVLIRDVFGPGSHPIPPSIGISSTTPIQDLSPQQHFLIHDHEPGSPNNEPISHTALPLTGPSSSPTFLKATNMVTNNALGPMDVNSHLYNYYGLMKPLNQSGTEYIREDSVSALLKLHFVQQFYQHKESNLGSVNRIESHNFESEMSNSIANVLYRSYLPAILMLNSQTSSSSHSYHISHQFASLFSLSPTKLTQMHTNLPMAIPHGYYHDDTNDPTILTNRLYTYSIDQSFNLQYQPPPERSYKQGRGLIYEQYTASVKELLLYYSSLFLQFQNEVFDGQVDPLLSLLEENRTDPTPTTFTLDMNELTIDQTAPRPPRTPPREFPPIEFITRFTDSPAFNTHLSNHDSQKSTHAQLITQIFDSISLLSSPEVNSNHSINNRSVIQTGIFDFCLFPCIQELNYSYLGHLSYQTRSILLQQLISSILASFRLLSRLFAIYDQFEQAQIMTSKTNHRNNSTCLSSLFSQSKIGSLLGFETDIHSGVGVSSDSSLELTSSSFHGEGDDSDPEIHYQNHYLHRPQDTTWSRRNNQQKERLDVDFGVHQQKRQDEQFAIISKEFKFTPFDQINEIGLYFVSVMNDLDGFITSKMNHLTEQNDVSNLLELEQLKSTTLPMLKSFVGILEKHTCRQSRQIDELNLPSNQYFYQSDDIISSDLITALPFYLSKSLQAVNKSDPAVLSGNNLQSPLFLALGKLLATHIQRRVVIAQDTILTQLVNETISRIKHLVSQYERLFSSLVEQIILEEIPVATLLTSSQSQLSEYYLNFGRNYPSLRTPLTRPESTQSNSNDRYSTPMQKSHPIQFDRINESPNPSSARLTPIQSSNISIFGDSSTGVTNGSDLPYREFESMRLDNSLYDEPSPIDQDNNMLYQILPPSLRHPDISSTTNKTHRDAMRLFSSSGRGSTLHSHSNNFEMSLIQHLLNNVSSSSSTEPSSTPAMMKFYTNFNTDSSVNGSSSKTIIAPTKSQNQFLFDFLTSPISLSSTPLSMTNLASYLKVNYDITLTPPGEIPSQFLISIGKHTNPIMSDLKYIPNQLPPAPMLSVLLEHFLYEKTLALRPSTISDNAVDDKNLDEDWMMHVQHYQMEGIFTFEKLFLLAFLRQSHSNSDDNSNTHVQYEKLLNLICSYPYSIDFHILLTKYHNPGSNSSLVEDLIIPSYSYSHLISNNNIPLIGPLLPPFLLDLFNYIYQNCHLPLLMALKRDYKRFSTLRAMMSVIQHHKQQTYGMDEIVEESKEGNVYYDEIDSTSLASPSNISLVPISSPLLSECGSISAISTPLESAPTALIGNNSNTKKVVSSRRKAREKSYNQPNLNVNIDYVADSAISKLNPEEPHQDGYVSNSRYYPSRQFNYFLYYLIQRLYLFSVDFNEI
jgi:hypothetical protein